MLKKSIFCTFFEILARPGLHRGPPGPGSDTRLGRAGRWNFRSTIHFWSLLRSLEPVSTRRTSAATLSVSQNPYSTRFSPTPLQNDFSDFSASGFSDFSDLRLPNSSRNSHFGPNFHENDVSRRRIFVSKPILRAGWTRS